MSLALPGGRLPVRRAPRLVLRFVLITAVGLAVAGVGVGVVVDRAVAKQSERQAVSRIVVATRALLDRQLRPATSSARLRPRVSSS